MCVIIVYVFMKMTALLPLVTIISLGITTTQGALTSFPLRPLPVLAGRSYEATGSGNEGQYVPDASGSYYHDDSGSYRHDNSGEYVPDYNPYIHEEGSAGSNFGPSGGSGGFGGGSGGFGGSGLGGGSGGLGGGTIVIGTGLAGLPAPTTTRAPTRASSLGSDIKPAAGISAAGGYGQPVALKQGNAAGLYDNRNYKIIRKIENVEPEGYNYLYETENGIYAEEEGQLANKGTDDEAIRAKGYFTYTGPDNVVYTVEYTADENGFVPSGAHLPTPPPIPEAILRSLEYQRSLGEL